jgi:hypothetical protein
MQYQKELQAIEEESKKLWWKIDDIESCRDHHWVSSRQRKLEKEYAECRKRKKELVSKINKYEIYHSILKNKIVFMIINDLTIGRTDNDLIALTSDEIDNFIKENNDKIEKVIENIIEDYDKDGEIELLKAPETDWIGEYLYEVINTMPFLEK